MTLSILLAAMLFEGVRGRYSTTLTYERPTADPIWFGGESRAEEAYASDYCVFLDIHYTDGTSTWQKWAKWTGGTHDWEKTANVFCPVKPVKSIDVEAFLRHGSGKAEFRNVFVERAAPPTGTVLATQRRTCLPFADADDVWVLVFGRKEATWKRRTESPSSFRPANPLKADATQVWWADSMSILTPLTFPVDAHRQEAVRLDIARGEREGFQALLSTGTARELDAVEIAIGEFRNEDGRAFPGSIVWERQGYVPLPPEYHHHPDSHHVGEKWVPDPLLPAGAMHVRKGMTQGALVTFAASRDAARGTYRGTVRFVAGGKPLSGEIPIEVTVRDFALPQTFGLRTGVAMMDGFLRKLYPDRFRAMKRAAWDIMLDHRLNPDDITRTSPPEIDDLLYARARGMNYFTVQNLVRPNPNAPWTLLSSPKELSSESFYSWFTNSLTPYVAELRRHGLDKMAAVYGFDERTKEYYPTIEKLYPKLKRDLGLDLITSAMLYRDIARGTLASNAVAALSADIYVPSTQVWKDDTTDWLRKQGKRVWWYTCCGPLFPYPNLSSLEYPPLEARVLVGWQTFAHRAEGYLFWAVNFWNKIDSPLDESDVFFDINTRSPFDMPGDGVMTYPGRDHVLPGMRLASMRDAVEDYEWLQLASAKDPAATAATIRRVTTGLKAYARDPKTLRAARAKLARIIEGNGLLRDADGREVTAFGVNYYAPFWSDYEALTSRGLGLHRVIDDDMAHFRRLGLDCLRLHAIDCQISTEDGALVDNGHLEAFDYLVSAAISNGMKVVLTPIAWFRPRKAPGDPNGFSRKHSKEQLCSDPKLEPVVTRFLREFVSHTNRYTNVRLADEPGIVAFECFNEPKYTEDFTDAQLTAKVNAFADAIRSTGTKAPVFFSVWQGRTDAICAGRIDGITASAYPTGIQHGCETEPPGLGRIVPFASVTNTAATGKARIVYEFDSADTCATYLVPALAMMFRSVGMQTAAMFQYDELPLASENAATRTHYLNLAYTPGKAIAMAIGAEIFRRVPRFASYETVTNTLVAPPFRIDGTRDAAELATDDVYYYTNGALSPPPDPSKLRHIWGVGRSTVVDSEGTGAYFLDRLAPGKWRLQLYPDIFHVADPFTGAPGVKVAALDRKVKLAVNLPDLGDRLALELAPGDYVLKRGGKIAPAPAGTHGPRFVMPPLVSMVLVGPRIPRQIRADCETAIDCPTAFASVAELSFVNGRGEIVRRPVEDGAVRLAAGTLTPGRWQVQVVAKGKGGTVGSTGTVDVCARSADWNLFDPERAANAWLFGGSKAWHERAQDADGSPAYRLHVAAFKGGKGFFQFRQLLDGSAFRATFPDAARPKTVVVRLRAATAHTTKVELVLYDDAGHPWGRTVNLTTAWRDIRMPVETFRYFSHWKECGSPPQEPTLDARRVAKVSLSLGAWLFPNGPELPHTIEFAALRIE